MQTLYTAPRSRSPRIAPQRPVRAGPRTRPTPGTLGGRAGPGHAPGDVVLQGGEHGRPRDHAMRLLRSSYIKDSTAHMSLGNGHSKSHELHLLESRGALDDAPI
jgi:hypothetical protein